MSRSNKLGLLPTTKTIVFDLLPLLGRPGIVAIFCFLLLMSGDYAEAVRPEIWRENSQQAFEKGTSEGVSLTRDGTVTLSPEFEKVADTGEGFVWALAGDGKGTVYIGTGPEGRIFVLKPNSQTPELLFDSPEVAIYSLVVGADGALYAGSSPGGLIYRLAPGKEPVAFCRTEDAHVWALLPQPGGGLYAATGGTQGRVLKISAKGEATEMYRSADPNVVSLVSGTHGVLYAGTDQNGWVYCIENETQTSVLYDAGEKEIHALAVGADGVVYAAAMARDAKPGSDPNANGGKKGTKEGSVLYAIRPSGSALRLWEVDDPLLLGLGVQPDGALLAVTGKKPRVYRVWPDGTATLLLHLKAVFPWAILPGSKEDVWVGTSGSGLVYRMGQGFAKKGTLTSEAHDFSLIANWGRVAWVGTQLPGTTLSVQTRSGNSEEPDDTWGAWSAPMAVSGGQIGSRAARFLQYRLQLTSETGQVAPLVREIRLAGMQENMPPMVLGVKVEPVSQGDKDSSSDVDVANGIWKIEWTGGDVNNDDLVYAIYFRNVGESHWRLLKEDVTNTSYIWRTHSVPDGTLQVRVVASDGASNPVGLTGEAMSLPFDVDNTAPIVRIAGVRTTGNGQVTVDGEIDDGASAIYDAAYALNSDDWQVVFPVDAIFDSAKETLSFVINQLKPGSYTLVVRARDKQGNVGAGKTIFEVK